VQVRDVTDRQMAELAIVENVQRKDLNAIEKATSFQRYLEEYNCTQEDLAARVHIDRSTVANLIRLLELPSTVKDMVAQGEISQGHARALLPLGEEDLQVDFARRIKRDGMSVRATETAVNDQIHQLDDDLLSLVTAEGESRPVAKRTRSEHLQSMEQELRTSLGAKVEIKQRSRGKGRITIHFTSHDEFERLLALLGQPAPAAEPSSHDGVPEFQYDMPQDQSYLQAG
jgi:ParB family chromosome partitioning protein